MTHAKEARHAPDVLIANAGTVFVFCPLTSRAKDWIDENLPQATRFGDAMIAEHRFAWGLVQGMVDDGLKVR